MKKKYSGKQVMKVRVKVLSREQEKSSPKETRNELSQTESQVM